MHQHGKVQKKTSTDSKLVLVGNPNVGKSVIFGALTGRYATVSNYPGTTVEVARGSARIGSKQYLIVDSPGVNSLLPMSEDEVVTRNILLNEPTDSVLQVLDSKNLRRGLLITVQLVEMGVPLSLVLNMYDEAGERGITIDLEGLSNMLGAEVVPTIATQRWNLDKINESLFIQKRPHLPVRYPAAIEEGIASIEALLPETRISRRSVAIMLLCGDPTLVEWQRENLSPEDIKKIQAVRTSVQSRYSESLGYVVNRTRLSVVDDIVDKAVTQEAPARGKLSTLIGEWSMHPLWGLPILALVLYVMYKFVGEFGAGTSVDFLESFVFGEHLNPWVIRVVEYVLPSGLLHDLIVGEYGIVTMALTYAIAIILPIVGYFFIFFSILEDSGYLPRLAIMVDRVFKLMGLNGKAVLPMVLGLGCDTMATMTTRILETKKERLIVTLLLALGVPCSAQLGVILGMLGAVSLSATLVWGAAVVLVMLFVGFLASRALPGEASDFILEIPPMRIPQARNIILKTLVRIQWYLKEAVPLFILGTLVLFVLNETNALSVLERVTAPVVVDFLGLPAKATEAFIVGFLRRDYGAAGLLALQRDGMLDPLQVVVSLVTMTLFVPCVANLFMMIKERGAKAALYMVVFIFPFAFLVGGVLNFILRLVGASF